ncbi:sugar transferase [Patulibacter brassicae]|uniref:Sugar transferase n=1 Tax=Patulibacter brassicae TaxID=1705717 RepID=A0ABU4VGX6_9ACTN|nr:sugar transferase [Patulibacter brassicae]MDX8151056.1 sugar transferase [Patulibacter brassicae]
MRSTSSSSPSTLAAEAVAGPHGFARQSVQPVPHALDVREREAAPAPAPAHAQDLAAQAAIRHRRNRRGRTRQVVLVVGDALAVGLPVAVFVAAQWPSALRLPLIPLLVAAIFSATMHLYGLYPRHPRYITTSTLNEIPKTFHATLLAAILSGFLLRALGAPHLGSLLGLMMASGIVLLPTIRVAIRHGLTGLLGAERVLLIGTGSVTPAAVRSLLLRRDIEVVDHLPVPATWQGEGDAWQLDPDGVLARTVSDERVDRILLSTRDLRATTVAEFLAWSRVWHVSLTVLPEHFDVVGVGATIDQVDGATVVSLQPPALSGTAQVMKRAMDIAGAGFGLVLLSPLMLAVAIAVRLDSPGGALFRQERVGRGGRSFTLVKFRSMVTDADALTEQLMAHSHDPNWLQIEDDPRVTRVGRFIRKTSLDELPQLWNVLVGDMSLVGPRPLSVRDDARVRGWERGRLGLTPGLTGLWQVLGRKTVPFEEMVKLDHLYVSNWSLWGDIKLLLQTLPAVIAARGAR